MNAQTSRVNDVWNELFKCNEKKTRWGRKSRRSKVEFSIPVGVVKVSPFLWLNMLFGRAGREEKVSLFSRHWSRQTLPSNYHASLGSLTQIQLKLFDHFINYDSSPYLTNGLNIKLPASGGNYFVDSMSVGVFCNSSGKKVFHFLKCLLLCFWF